MGALFTQRMLGSLPQRYSPRVEVLSIQVKKFKTDSSTASKASRRVFFWGRALLDTQGCIGIGGDSGVDRGDAGAGSLAELVRRP